jgi:hypothetical protein
MNFVAVAIFWEVCDVTGGVIIEKLRPRLFKIDWN